MSNENENLTAQFLDEHLKQYDRFFSSMLWKKSLLPWLKAQREIANRALIQGKDHIEMDVQRGRVLMAEAIINLPKFIEYRIEAKTKESVESANGNYSSPSTDAYEGLMDSLTGYSPKFDDDVELT